jgi:hypothetical protein
MLSKLVHALPFPGLLPQAASYALHARGFSTTSHVTSSGATSPSPGGLTGRFRVCHLCGDLRPRYKQTCQTKLQPC